ncbi:hypothetical protein EON62_03245 [archaeon]|nr:MAG: hypothetical protein EON62_03245 [archaeon]
MQLNDDATVEARAARKAAARAARIKKALGGDDDGEDGFSDDEGEARTEAGAGTYVPAKISRRILDEARLQQMEDEEDPAFTGAAAGRKKSVKFGAHAARSGATAAASGHSFLRAGGMDGEEDEEENEVVEFDAGDGTLRARACGVNNGVPPADTGRRLHAPETRCLRCRCGVGGRVH